LVFFFFFINAKISPEHQILNVDFRYLVSLKVCLQLFPINRKNSLRVA